MRKRDIIIFGFAAVCLIAALLIAGLSGTAVAQDSRAAPTTVPAVLYFECPADQECHILQQQGSKVYDLCAGSGGQYGRFDLEIYGADSHMSHCVGQNE